VEEKKLTRIPIVTASELGKAQAGNLTDLSVRIVAYGNISSCGPGQNALEYAAMEGDSPVHDLEIASYGLFSESRIAWKCNLNGR